MQAFVSATNEFALACIDGLIGPATERQIVPPAVVHTYYGRSHVDDVDGLPHDRTPIAPLFPLALPLPRTRKRRVRSATAV